jgi:TDG/mug DNA glycosylase family protein
MHQELPDYLRPGLKVVFVGFNPGELSAHVGHYYANPQNQFWNLLFESRLVPERLTPEEDERVLEFGIGLTDVVKRWTPSAGDLTATDYREGIPSLKSRLLEARPCMVAFNGKGAYKRFCGHEVDHGWQRERICGSRIFVLPSTSPANARVSRDEKLRYFRELARWVKRHCRDGFAPTQVAAAFRPAMPA